MPFRSPTLPPVVAVIYLGRGSSHSFSTLAMSKKPTTPWDKPVLCPLLPRLDQSAWQLCPGEWSVHHHGHSDDLLHLQWFPLHFGQPLTPMYSPWILSLPVILLLQNYQPEYSLLYCNLPCFLLFILLFSHQPFFNVIGTVCPLLSSNSSTFPFLNFPYDGSSWAVFLDSLLCPTLLYFHLYPARLPSPSVASTCLHFWTQLPVSLCLHPSIWVLPNEADWFHYKFKVINFEQVLTLHKNLLQSYLSFSHFHRGCLKPFSFPEASNLPSFLPWPPCTKLLGK